jgi:hypothetical protein
MYQSNDATSKGAARVLRTDSFYYYYKSTTRRISKVPATTTTTTTTTTSSTTAHFACRNVRSAEADRE